MKIFIRIWTAQTKFIYGYFTLLLIMFLLFPGYLKAQLSGEYTIGQGGVYATFNDAVNDLKTQGVSGPVTFGIKAGTYLPINPNERILYIDQNIQGVSETNTITFQPDYFSGANINNVILTRYTGGTSVGDGIIIHIRSSYITIKDITLKNQDTTTNSMSKPMVYISRQGNSGEIRNVEILNCNIIGKGTHNRSSWGTYVYEKHHNIKVEGNIIDGCVNGISLYRQSFSGTIRNNEIKNTSRYQTNSGAVGYGVYAEFCTDLLIQGNTIDYSNGALGSAGIAVSSSSTLIIDANIIKNTSSDGGGSYDTYTAISVYAPPGFSIQSALVSNNMISGIWNNRRRGISLIGKNFKVYNNSVVMPARLFTFGHDRAALYINSDSSDVKNNILIDLSTGTSGYVSQALFISDTTSNNFDFNILHHGGNRFVRANGVVYHSLESWQQTGYDLNSLTKVPDFVSVYNDLHLFDCSAADEELKGIKVPEVLFDIDGEARHPDQPFIGADEGLAELPGLFGSPTDFNSGEQTWSFTSFDLDLDGAVDLIAANTVYNSGSNDITILWNEGNMNFSSPVHLPFGNNPNIVKAGFINDDNLPDLVVVNYDSIMVRFGSGNRTFTNPVLISNGESQNLGDMQLADYDNDGDTDILALYSPSTDTGFVVIYINDGDGTFSWLNSAYAGKYLDQLKIADFDNDNFPDLAIVDNGNYSLYILKNLGTTAPGISAGFDDPVEYNAQVYSFPSESKFVTGDFNGDGYTDIILGRAGNPDSLVMMKNLGGGTFERESFLVHPSRTPRVIDALDYEGDGDLDIVTGNTTKDMHLLLNNGSGNFERALVCSQGNLSKVPQAVLTAKLDNNNSADIAVLGSASNFITVFSNLQWVPTSIDNEINTTIPGEFILFNNYPNPFNPSTTISYSIPVNAFVQLKVFDILGCEVTTLINEEKPSGHYKITFDASHLASGIYLYSIQAGSFNQVKKMILLR